MDELLYTFIDKEGFVGLDMTFVEWGLDVLCVYINLYFLIPKFLIKKRFPPYFIFSFISVVLVALLTLYYSYLPEKFILNYYEVSSSLVATATVLATAVAIKIGKYSLNQLRVNEELKLEQSKLELNYLKQQINPHFLFNVLNTIHIQSKTDSESVSETVLHLSDLLRYQIYDAGGSDAVALQKEVDFIKNYISLEELRRTNLTLTWSVPEQLPKVKITPFLFLPLIENAFKHSRSINETPTTIDVAFKHDQQTLSCQVINTIGDTHEKEEGGFGIDSLKKRLNFLYPNKHTLEMNSKENLFTSTLSIELDEGHNH